MRLMIALIRSLYAPLISLILLIIGSGLLNTFVSVRLEIEGFSTSVIGIVSSSLYAGILLGSLKLEPFIAKKGHAKAFGIFAIICVALILLQALWIDPFYWSALRLVAGICTAGIFIVIESWLLIASPPSLRGAILSLYLALFYGALSMGQFLFNWIDPKSNAPLWYATLFFAISLSPLLLAQVDGPKIEPSEKMPLKKLYNLSPLGFFGGIISGMVLSAIYGLVPLYAKGIGLEISDIGTLMGVIILGGLSFQWPLGRWADKKDRGTVLHFSAWMSAFFGLLIALIPSSFNLLLLMSWLFGGFAFTLYPLSMAYTCDKISEEQIVAATGGFVLSYGIGAILGPLLAPFAISWFGMVGLFYFLAFITALLAIASFRRIS